MSAYLVTSPYGPLRANRWSCFSCPDECAASEVPAGDIRDAAKAHAEATGHQVEVWHGTCELLLALATTAAESGVPG